MDLTLYFSQNTVITQELLDTITLLNFPEQLATGTKFLDYLDTLQWGGKDKISETKLRMIKQLQKLFDYQLRKINPDINIMKGCLLGIKFLLGSYLNSEVSTITESEILTDINSNINFNIISSTDPHDELTKINRTQVNLLQDLNLQWYLPVLNDRGFPITTTLVFVIYNGLSLPGVQLDTTVIPNRIYGFLNNSPATIEVIIR